MKNNKNHKMAKGYQHVISQIRHYFKNLDQHLETDLEQAFENAKQTLHNIGEFTNEEWDLIRNSIKRDMNHSIHANNHSGASMRDWLEFDWELIEQRTEDIVAQVADKTYVEHVALDIDLQLGPDYRSGELVGRSTLMCKQCQYKLNLTKTSTIPECPECHGKIFKRIK